jgi:hypothetical protein
MSDTLPALRRASSESGDLLVSLDVALCADAAAATNAVRATARVIDEAYMVCSGMSCRE